MHIDLCILTCEEREGYTYVPGQNPSLSLATATRQNVNIYAEKHIVICGIAGPVPLAQATEFLGFCCPCCLPSYLPCSFLPLLETLSSPRPSSRVQSLMSDVSFVH